jgi:hypothetical protein
MPSFRYSVRITTGGGYRSELTATSDNYTYASLSMSVMDGNVQGN